MYSLKFTCCSLIHIFINLVDHFTVDYLTSREMCGVACPLYSRQLLFESTKSTNQIVESVIL